MTIPVSPSVVRIATPDDYQELWRLFLQSHRENGLFELAPEKVEWFLVRVLRPDLIPPGDTGVRGVIGVIGEAGKLEGLCFLIVNSLWYTNQRHIEELLVYVDPEFRCSAHAKSLIQWMKGQSDIVQLPLVSGVVSTERTASKVRLYKRMLPEAGAFFLWKPSTTVSSSMAAVA